MDQPNNQSTPDQAYKAAKKTPETAARELATSRPGIRPLVALKRILFDPGPDGASIEDIEAAFHEIDVDGGGCIDLSELVEALQSAGLNASTAATENVFKEIDKNLSGDVDLGEFEKFFRHMDELHEFEQKRAQRAQFMTCLLNFCFLADIVAVGVLLLLFIRMDPDENPDSYIIARNVMMGASILLAVLFLSVILIPVMRLVFGPKVQYWQKRVEEKAKQAQLAPKNNNKDPGGPGLRGAGDASAPPPSMNSKTRTYRPKKFMQLQLEEEAAMQAAEGGHANHDHRRSTKGSRMSGHTVHTNNSSKQGAIAVDMFDDQPYQYDAYNDAAIAQSEEVLKGQISFCPMNGPTSIQQQAFQESIMGPLPGAVTGPMALADTAYIPPSRREEEADY